MFGCFLGLRLFVDATASGLGSPILVQVFLGRGEVAVRAWSFLLSGLNYSQFIWNVADVLRGTYKQHQYGQIILPFTVLARLDAVLEPTKQAVLAAAEGYLLDTIPPAMLSNRVGHDYSFFNLSRHNLIQNINPRIIYFYSKTQYYRR